MLRSRRLLAIPLLAAVVGVGTVSDASAQRVEATAQTVEVVENGDLVDLKFRLAVTNGESSVAVNAWVVFADGQEVYVGDVAADGSASSAQQTRMIDVSATPTRHFPVPVTVRFTLNGVNVELTQTLVLHLYVPEGQGQ